ncbi:TPA: formate dehydrogenase accessory sulfurtransferase FdhD, partial [bacterium]|nr:formate dehydrogenase accessory sulfurtransferase FdhD [bacterium]
DLEYLTIGFLFTTGLIKKIEDINKIEINHDKEWVACVNLKNLDSINELSYKRLYPSGGGSGILFNNSHRGKITQEFKIESKNINSLMNKFQKKSEIFFKTGAVHSAAIADKQNILIFKEDIGRHNAIDKVIGCGLKQNILFEDKIMLTTGRIPSEVILKIQTCRLPVIISKAAPTDQAIKLANDIGITLVGFARGNGMNIYSLEERIIKNG